MKKEKEHTYFVPWMWLYLGELEFSVVRVHALDLLPGWSSQNLNKKFKIHIHIIKHILRETLNVYVSKHAVKNSGDRAMHKAPNKLF